MPRTAFLIALLGLGAAVPAAAQTDSVLLRRALRLHRAVPMFDMHNDHPWERRAQRHLDATQPSMRGNLATYHTDIPRLRAGGVGAQFWSTYIQDTMTFGVRETLFEIDIVKRMEAAYPDVFLPARTAADVMRAHREGKIASLIGMEGGQSIGNSLAALRMLYDLGARYMTLTWNRDLAWADANMGQSPHQGLTPFGREVVREMNRLGMLVDLSHVSDSVMVQALRISEAPIIFSHSSARALANHTRNVPDEVLRMVPANGGVVAVNFLCEFVDSARLRWSNERGALLRQWRQQLGRDTAAIRAAARAWMEANPAPRTTLAIVADHIDHIRRTAGIDHVAYGSDFDGIDCAPDGLSDVSMFPSLTAELLRRGYSDDDVKKVIGLNMLRVMRQAEAVARRLQRERPPSTATLAIDSVGN